MTTVGRITFTPGPWRVCQFEGHVESQDGRLVANCMGSYNTTLDMRPENNANARLIAAAPDLLHALKWAADQLSQHGFSASPGGVVHTLHAVIAKAEGHS